ncbi:MAG TPA: glycosyltransferase [Candidatus Eremiobacteraceae bacterium]|nr:glycosyltransferase [Candidatus Eremiobacteraceae bacterium]
MNISILIPARDEAANIGPLLESLLAADLGVHALTEIVVYDDMSTDQTATIVEEIATRAPRVRVIRGTMRVGCAGAVTHLLKAARGDAILRINADVRVCDGAIRLLADAIESGASLAVGAQEPLLRRITVPALASSFAFAVIERLKAGEYLRHYAVGHLLAFARDTIADAELPPEIINDDHYLAMHIFRKGGTIVYVPEARCQLNPATTFADYWRVSRRVLEGERQLRRGYGVEATPFHVLASAVLATAARKPARAACWALMYTISSSLPSPVRNSAWETVRSTKTRIA